MFIFLLRVLTISSVVYLGGSVFLKFYPPAHIDSNLPKYGKHLKSKRIFHPIVQLKRDYKMCSGVVIDDNYIMTAAHCVDGILKHYKGSIEIFDRYGKVTGTFSRVVGFYPDYDIALLKGDFTKFEYIEVDSYKGPKFGKTYQTCGFPSLQNKLTCTNFIPTQNLNFMLAGTGFILRGMSGGPVIDTVNNKVIGVNSAVTGDLVLVGPALGILGLFDIE